MKSSGRIRELLGAIFLMAVAGAVGAQSAASYPNKPIRMVAAEAGGGGDTVARMIVPGLGSNLGQPVIIDNRGGSATIPIEVVVKAPPDGYTILMSGGSLWLLPLLQEVSYDPLKDLVPITLGLIAPQLMVVHPSVPVKSVKEFIALAKAKPGELNYSSGISGSGPHLAGELFKAIADVNLVRIPYKGGTPALLGLLAGQTQVMFATTTSVAPHVKSGKLRALAVTSLEPSAQFPDLLTVASQGVPGFESVAANGVFAPARTATAVINRLNLEINKVLQPGGQKSLFERRD